MFRASCVLAVALLCSGAAAPLESRAVAQDAAKEGNKPADNRPPEKPPVDELAQEATTQGSVTVEGHTVASQAIAGTVLVASKATQDAAFNTGTTPNVKFDDANAVPHPH